MNEEVEIYGVCMIRTIRIKAGTAPMTDGISPRKLEVVDRGNVKFFELSGSFADFRRARYNFQNSHYPPAPTWMAETVAKSFSG